MRIRPGKAAVSAYAARAAEGVGPYYFVSSKTWRFHLIRHPACGRRRMPPSPQGEGFDEDAIAYFCIHMYTKYNYNHNPNHNPTTTQPQPRPDPDSEPSSHSHTPPSSQPDRKRGGVVESVENRRAAAFRFPVSVVYSPREG